VTRQCLRPCLDCGRPTIGPRCPAHTTDYGYASLHWQRVRAARLQVDGHLCQFNYPGCIGHATTVHLAPELAGDHSLATLETTRSACHHCHGIEDAPRASGLPATSAQHWGGGAPTATGRPPEEPASHLAVCTGLGVSG
jgi:hypothetical protein